MALWPRTLAERTAGCPRPRGAARVVRGAHGVDGEAAVAVDSEDPDRTDSKHEDLRRDLVEAKTQLAATSEVLTALGRSASDLDAILGTVVENAKRLCHADVAQIHLLEGRTYRLAARSAGLTEEFADYMRRNPALLDRSTLMGRVGLDRRAQQIVDVLADPDYGRRDYQLMAGFRTTLGVPMMLVTSHRRPERVAHRGGPLR